GAHFGGLLGEEPAQLLGGGRHRTVPGAFAPAGEDRPVADLGGAGVLRGRLLPQPPHRGGDRVRYRGHLGTGQIRAGHGVLILWTRRSRARWSRCSTTSRRSAAGASAWASSQVSTGSRLSAAGNNPTTMRRAISMLRLVQVSWSTAK